MNHTAYDKGRIKKARPYFCVGWCKHDTQIKHYHSHLFETRHDAERLAHQMAHDDPTSKHFVDVTYEPDTCSRCNGSGQDPQCDDECVRCFGLGLTVPASKHGERMET